MSPPTLRRYRAERLLRKEFLAQRSRVLAVVRSRLRAKGVTLDAADLEACYAQAWHGLYAKVLEGEEIESPPGWLVLVTFRRALDESRSLRHFEAGAQRDGIGDLDQRAERSNLDIAAELDNRARLRQVFEGMRARLSERECEAASLCYLQGLSRAQAAERMGISDTRMRKLMEGSGAGRPGVASKVGGLLDTIQAGSWCEQQSSLMRALAFGILDPEGERHALAMAHCRECPACRAQVASLRGLASVLPLPLLWPLALAGGGGSATRAGTRTGRGATSAGVRIGRVPGWSGLPASLIAKVAVTVAVLVGAGYALLGSRAHGRPPNLAAPSTATTVTLPHTPLAAFGASVHRVLSTRSASIGPGRSLYTVGSARGARGGEFSPERVRRQQAVAPLVPTHAPSQSSSSRAPREFGIE